MRRVLTVITILAFSLVLSRAEDAANPGNSTEAKKPGTEEKLITEEKPPEPKLPFEERFSQPISLDLRNIDIIEALKFIATKGSLNIVTTKDVSGRVTLTLENVPLKDVFEFMVRSNGLAYVMTGEVLNVMTETEYKAIYGKNFFDIRQASVFRLKYAIPEQAFSLLDALKSDIGRVLVDQESGNVLILDTPEKTAEIRKALEEFEKENMVEVFSLRYAKAKEVEDILKTRLDSKKVGFIKADERNNQVIVQTLPERMEEVARLIKSLDRQTKEIVIDTKIVKVTLSNQLDNGVEWEGLFRLAAKNGLSYLGSTPYSAVQSSTAAWQPRQQVVSNLGDNIGSYPFSGTTSNFASSTATAPGENLHFGVITNKQDYDVMMNLLNTLGESRILSNPKIVAVNNQEAKIHVGERRAYVTTTTTTGQTTSTISEEVNFVDVGIQLAVTPTINDDGYITMKVKPEVSSVSSILTTPTNNKIPIIDTSMAETTIMVKDNTTIIIAGLRREEKTNSSAGLPWLSKIPFLGFLARSGTANTQRVELVVLMTPHIISGDQLNVGDERAFGDKPGKDYREHEPLVPDSTVLPGGAPAGVQFKPYKDYLTFKEKSEEEILIKGPKDDTK
ncbi:MAG TPA: secretin N-terminal domain-containing protein [Candidatus Margulisiibacteriota bacterium]|nr:secretin N-terminal domain-containing protein [Candidatus Margulisiibacteriota bacterium]